MAYSVKKSLPLNEVRDSCFICNEEFSSNYDLTKHLLDHANEAKFKDLLANLEYRLSARCPPTTAPIRTPQEPEFIKTSFRRPLKRRNPTYPLAEPKVVEIITIDDDEPSDNVMSNPVAVVAEPEGVEIVTIDDDEPFENVVTKPVAVIPGFKLVKREKLQNISPEIGSYHGYYPSTSAFFGINGISEHVVIKKEPSAYFCYICKKPYISKPSLRNHLFRHIRDPCFQCGFCLKKFTMKNILQKHKEKHSFFVGY